LNRPDRFEAEDFHARLTSLRHDLHRHPELGFEEMRTKAMVATRLRELGLEVHEGVGVVGLLRAGSGNRAIGLRADMDALPITEASTHDYASGTPGTMHACGHDGHVTMLLGGAQHLARTRAFDGTAYHVDRCAAHVASPEGAACRRRGCLARRACWVGQDWVPEPDRAAFHMAAFLRARGAA